MNMRKDIINSLRSMFLISGLLLFVACSSDDTVNKEVPQVNDKITFATAVSNSVGSSTRADALAGHYAFQSGTKMTMRIQGEWTDHTPNPVTVYVTGTAEADTNTDNINDVTLTKTLYWEDFGTGDPNNATARYDEGLEILAVALDDKTYSTTPSTPTVPDDQWQGGYPWDLTPTSPATEIVLTDKDLLVSNNLSGTNGYKYDHRNEAGANRLDFKHVMSKITFNVTAGASFTDSKFASNPTIALTAHKDGANDQTEWTYLNGTINIQSGEATGSTLHAIELTKPTSDPTASQPVTESTLIYPGSCFGTTDDAIIAKIDADGNVYYVTAKEIRAKIATLETTPDYKTKGGYHYILNVSIEKTGLSVTATIADWTEVTADLALPSIDVSTAYGQKNTEEGGEKPKFTKEQFDLFLSKYVDATSIKTGYDYDNTTEYVQPARVVSYDATNGSYSLNEPLYWPDHTTRYYFRGLWPLVGIASTGISSPVNLTVETYNGTQENIDVVQVQNVAYTKDTWPSDLAIAIPRAGTHEGEIPEPANGISSTSGEIRMNFEYAMSKVEFNIKSSSSTASEQIVLDPSKTIITLVGGYDKGRITLMDGKHDTWTDADKNTSGYIPSRLSSANEGFTISTLDAIIPQILDDNVKLRIDLTDGTNIIQTYYAQLNKIKIDNTTTLINEWEHGKYYKYNLNILKTGVQVTATLADWVTVNAQDNVWF